MGESRQQRWYPSCGLVYGRRPRALAPRVGGGGGLSARGGRVPVLRMRNRALLFVEAARSERQRGLCLPASHHQVIARVARVTQLVVAAFARSSRPAKGAGSELSTLAAVFSHQELWQSAGPLTARRLQSAPRRAAAVRPLASRALSPQNSSTEWLQSRARSVTQAETSRDAVSPSRNEPRGGARRS